MAKARGLRPRTLSVVFGGYFLLVVAAAFYLSPYVAIYVDPGATRWILAAYALSGALLSVGASLGAVRRWMRLDARLAELEEAEHEAIPSSAGKEDVTAAMPTDQDVDQLLTDLERIGERAAFEARPDGEPPAKTVIPEDPGLRAARSREIKRLTKARDGVAAYAAGPVAASIGLIGVFAPLLPASDGMLLADLRLNALVGIMGLGWLVGLAAYAGAAFRRLGRGAA